MLTVRGAIKEEEKEEEGGEKGNNEEKVGENKREGEGQATNGRRGRRKN